MMVSGCATATVSSIIAFNRENVLKLSIGMTKAEVLDIMGTKTVKDGFLYCNMTINNPYRSEILQGKDKTFEIIYYFTDEKGKPCTISDDDLTPLIFDNGKLIGWGQNFLQDNVQKYEIRIR